MLDDIWSAAQNVRMWLATAEGCLGADAPRSGLARLFSRRVSRHRVDEAVDAIGKTKVAYLDLEFALHRAEMDPVDLATLHMDVFKSANLGVARVVQSDAAVDQMRAAVTADLARIDALIAGVEALQRASRQA
jgi:hypothetical protein